MKPYPKKLRLTASLVTCLSLAGCAGGQFETAAPTSHNPTTSTSDGLCTATRSEMTVSVGDVFADGDWVRDFGVDGFRVDTAKHVEPEAWKELKAEAQKALDSYRRNNPDQPLPAEDFWMVAEVFPHSVSRSSYFDAGFDAVINFDLQEEAHAGVACLPEMEAIYSDYAKKMNGDRPFNVMSYISSHDTQLFSRIADNDPLMQKRAASALLFTPGTSQIFYGDETGRRFGPTGSDGHQGTRSDMNWADIGNGKAEPVLSHWKKLGQFRARHPAIGAGKHKHLSAEPYVFSRTRGDDRVVIAFGKE